ncbi:phosphoethanolamine transferase domain-containing protein [Acinetobacter bereziniae]|uniref:phosphoethanolamine transferase domain-containing protein n=1 Tax=Acinetobacter bereziniae TaxID=106648 RepID=UPI00301740F7
MQKNISSTMFYSLIFAMGGAPTIAMLIIQAQTTDPAIVSQALLGLSVMIACILVPIVLIQNAFLFFKRNDQQLEQKIIPLKNIYLALNVLCLMYWLMVQFL